MFYTIENENEFYQKFVGFIKHHLIFKHFFDIFLFKFCTYINRVCEAYL